MAIEVEGILLAVAAIVGAAFLANQLFRRYRIPDVLLLIGTGILVGPVLGLADVGLFRTLAPLLGTIAILVILFDGGLEIRLVELRQGATSGALLAALVFPVTAAACTLVAQASGLAFEVALLLGLALGGAGVVIVVPLIRRLAGTRATTAVTVEAAFADVFVIVGVYVAASAIATGEADSAAIAGTLAAALGIGIALGLGAGYAWARLLAGGWLRGYEYVLTLAALFLTHVVVEAASGSGPMAVLAFGLVLGNSKRSRSFADASKLAKGQSEALPVFTDALAGVQQEAVFLVRAFVFVGLGVTLDLAVFGDPVLIMAGATLSATIALVRLLASLSVLRSAAYSAWDRVAVGLMFHRGLAAAALSQVPFAVYGIAEAEILPSYVAIVIILTNVLGSLLVWGVSWGPVRRRLGGQASAMSGPEH